MASKKKQKNQESTHSETQSYRLYNYSLRFASIFALYLIVLLMLKYQADIKYVDIFAILALILSAKFTITKYIKDQEKLFDKEEKFKLIWSSWALSWFTSIIVIVIGTVQLAGEEKLHDMLGYLSAMPTLYFVGFLLGISLGAWALLYIVYHYQASREYESFMKLKEKSKNQSS